MTFGEAVTKAITERDAPALARAVDALRFRGVTYAQIYKVAFRLTGIGEAEFDAMLEMAEEMEETDAA